MSAAPTPMVLAAARALSAQAAQECNVDADDQWKVYSDVFMVDAEAALKACGAFDLLEALQAEEEWRARDLSGAIDPEWDYETMVGAKRRAAIAKATGSTT